MAVSAFKSTSKRGSFLQKDGGGDGDSARSNPDELGKKTVMRRSRSVSAFPRDRSIDLSRPSPLDFANKRDNPLFGSTSSSPESPKSMDVVGIRGMADTLDSGMGRAISGASSSRPGSSSGLVGDGERRGRSVCRREPFRAGSVKAPSRSVSRVDTGRRQRSVSRGHYGNPERSAQTSDSEESVSAIPYSHAEEKTIKAVFEQMKTFQHDHPTGDAGALGIHETVRSEVRRAVFEVRQDLENAIWRNPNLYASDIANAASKLVSPDGVELVSDIRKDYSAKLAESQERTRNLKADLAIEEQRSQELSRILKEVLPEPKAAGRQKPQTKRKTSMERKKMSRRLEEDALNYFDECVSISTFDSSDLSCPEESTHSSSAVVALTDGRKQHPCDGASSSDGPLFLYEVLNEQPQNWLSDRCNDVVGLTTGQPGNFQFSIARDASEKGESTNVIRSLIKQFGKETEDETVAKCVRTSYDEDHYHLVEVAERLLFEKVIFRNRINSGGLLLCSDSIF
ncbi:uncharacterized protein LOC116246459 [Nymphaea colorata]|nr:uncharacterized protein LOC116246459 [Nymphaea colorata]